MQGARQQRELGSVFAAPRRSKSPRSRKEEVRELRTSANQDHPNPRLPLSRAGACRPGMPASLVECASKALQRAGPQKVRAQCKPPRRGTAAAIQAGHPPMPPRTQRGQHANKPRPPRPVTARSREHPFRPVPSGIVMRAGVRRGRRRWDSECGNWGNENVSFPPSTSVYKVDKYYNLLSCNVICWYSSGE